LFTGRGAPHAVGHDHHVAVLVGELSLTLVVEGRLENLERFGEAGNQKLVFVLGARQAGMGQSTHFNDRVAATFSLAR
jgi:hypothetical protein